MGSRCLQRSKGTLLTSRRPDKPPHKKLSVIRCKKNDNDSTIIGTTEYSYIYAEEYTYMGRVYVFSIRWLVTD